MSRPTLARFTLPLLVFVLTAGVYVATLGPRLRGPSDNAHFVHLAQSFLEGQLSVVGNKPPGDNDWSRYAGRWYVSFPPFPAVVILPAVAVWGTAVWDRLFWALCAGLGPALLYVLLRRLRETSASGRSVREDLSLTALFAFGTVYYYTAVQGTVWFAAHVVAVPLIVLYLLWGLGARRPLLAGLALGLAFMTRPTTLLLGAAFLLEAIYIAQRPRAEQTEPEATPTIDDVQLSAAGTAGTAAPRLTASLRSLDWLLLARKLAWFALPLLLIGGLAMWMNAARFDDPFEFGHTHLNIRWRGRIEKWGLFNYHYFSKNLAVFLAALPWISAAAPYLKLSRHGLALWFTTPHYLGVLWPRRKSQTLIALAVAAAAVAVLDLCYQNSGWIQFGYRFSLDYSVLLIAMLALGGRTIDKAFYALLVFAFAVNLFGAITFDRVGRYYDNDPTQNVMFQPD